MRGIAFAATLVGVSLLMLLPGTASATNRYVYYGACGHTASAAPSHSCSASSDKAAFFKSRDAAVSYKVCVKFPNGKKLCADAQQAGKGKLRHNTITSSVRGAHKITWFVDGSKVGGWTLNVT